MATYVTYAPDTPIAKAMFNFDAFGVADYKLAGAIRVSVSDSFSRADYLSPNYSAFYSQLYTSGSAEVAWTTQMLSNVQDVLATYSRFANLSFQWQGDFDTAGARSTANPEDVGRANVSDINLTWVTRPDAGYAGISGGNSDRFVLGYSGAAGDIFLNRSASAFGGDYTLDLNTRARQTLEHELGHSLGLSHPHSTYSNGVPVITADFAATRNLGFDQLGFRTDIPADMYKEYFTIMSYDDQQSFLPGSGVLFHAFTPMILDVIALQQAYGEGAGTSGSGNDTITAGTAGYRTYFDKGGIDTIDLSEYEDGAYLHMGADITGASHKVGVAMSLNDGLNTIRNGGDPANLRWFYGEYENAAGSPNADLIVGNSLDNAISGLDGNDTLNGGAGDDALDGGAGIDIAVYSGNRNTYSTVMDGTATRVSNVSGSEGSDTLTHLERLQFANTNLALDIDGNAGTVARILGAIVGKESVTNKIYVGAGLRELDGGASYQSLVQLALNARLGTPFATTDEVKLLYHNVLGTEPLASDLAYWNSSVTSGQYSQVSLAMLAADTSLNAANINLVGLATTGLEYL